LAATTPEEAEASLKKALDEQSILQAEYPGVPEYQRTVGRGHYQLSLLLVRSKPAEAVLEAEKAQALHQQVLLTRPDSEPDQRFVMEDQILLSQALIAAGRLPEAMAVAEQLPSIRPADPRLIAHAVGLLIRCAGAVKDTSEGRKQAEDCLARAVGMLRNAVRAKVIRSRATLDEKDFDRLRDRDDFKTLRDSVDESVHVG
jgi:hypothetical protein